MNINAQQSKIYLNKFDNFLIKYLDFIQKAEPKIEHFLQDKIHLLGYNNIVADYLIEEFISFNWLAAFLILLIVLYIILRKRH